jgi:hypothetical protein
VSRFISCRRPEAAQQAHGARSLMAVRQHDVSFAMHFQYVSPHLYVTSVGKAGQTHINLIKIKSARAG